MKLALAQLNPTVGDLTRNADAIIAAVKRGAKAGVDLVVCPELAVSGYPPRDLVEVPSYLAGNRRELERIAAETADCGAAVLTGYVDAPGQPARQPSANFAALLDGGEIVFRQQKMLLPNYDVFDEWRYFAPAPNQQVVELRGLRLGVTICEDAWNDKQFWERPNYDRDPVEELALEGVDLMINISASPYHLYRRRLRLEMIRAAARRHGTPFVMVNQVGGNDHLIFDGSSFAIDDAGELRARACSFAEDLVLFDTAENSSDLHGAEWPAEGGADAAAEHEAVYDALVLGVRDYVRKCGFRQAIVGLSGGIDSSLTVSVAVDALGPENVLGVSMPGPYSSEGSKTDARHTADKLAIRFETLDINEAYGVFERKLAPIFGDLERNVAEENLQARLRGNTLMALSNKLGALVLTTGNKSETAVGYCTLYGDMAGGLAVLADVPKTLVYELCSVVNRRHPDAISESVMTKPPSAELSPDQKDTDSLPPYEILDPILKGYVEEHKLPAEIAPEVGAEQAVVERIARMVDRNEYKRQQSAPGLRVTSKAFGMGRRFPIAQRYFPANG